MLNHVDGENFEIKKKFSFASFIFNSKFLDGLKAPEESIIKTIEYLEKNNLGQKKTNYRLKDWGISRQRYWGCPIPIAYDENNQPIKIPKNIIWFLPKITKLVPSTSHWMQKKIGNILY